MTGNEIGILILLIMKTLKLHYTEEGSEIVMGEIDKFLSKSKGCYLNIVKAIAEGIDSRAAMISYCKVWKNTRYDLYPLFTPIA